jgi:hypothetical protein
MSGYGHKASQTKGAAKPQLHTSARVPHSAPPGLEREILSLHGEAGNRAVSELLEPGEQSAPAPQGNVPPIVQSVLESGGGAPLDSATRALMESGFGEDFSQVRVHTDDKAAQSARSVDALAYTYGNDIVFARDQVDSTGGTTHSLLAHELAHVVQQLRAVSAGTSTNEQRLEQTANTASKQLLQGTRPLIPEASPPSLMRQKTPEQKSGSDWFRVTTDTLFVEGFVVASFELKGDGAKLQVSRNQELDAVGVSVPEVNYSSFKLNMEVREQLQNKGYLIDSYKDEEGNQTVHVTRPLTIHPTKPKPVSAPKSIKASKGAGPLPRVTPEPVTSQPVEEEESTPEPQKLPKRSPEQLIDANTEFLNLDEEKLGRTLLDYVTQGSLDTVNKTLDELDSSDRDDVALEIVKAASDEHLEQLAQSTEGRNLILRMYDELTSGHEGEDERVQAERLLHARVQQIDPEKFIKAEQEAMVIPFSSVGWTKLGSASLSVTRLANGKIQLRSHMKPEHYKDAKRLPSINILMGSGIEIDPDEVVGLHLYDEGDKIVYVPAMNLLRFSNQETAKIGSMAGEAVIAGATLGAGAEAVAAGEGGTATGLARGLTTLKWADRAATVVQTASTLINEHRGLILRHFGNEGEEFLKEWRTVETVVAYYGMARGAVALGQGLNALRTSYKNWRAARSQLKNLTAQEEQALDQIAQQAEKSFSDLEASQLNASKVDPDIDEAVERSFVELDAPAPRISSPKPPRLKTNQRTKAARAAFKELRHDYAAALGVERGGQVHHAIELQTLERYPGVYTQGELNAFQNMRGVMPERAGRRQFHNSKIREIWDRHYNQLDDLISQHVLSPGTPQYNAFVRRYLSSARDEMDHVLGQFFSESWVSAMKEERFKALPKVRIAVPSSPSQAPTRVRVADPPRVRVANPKVDEELEALAQAEADEALEKTVEKLRVIE